MKKSYWIATAAALATVVISATAAEVLSANAVGYIKKTLPPSGKFVMMSIPLDSMTEESIVFGRTSVAQEAPQNSTVVFWDEASQSWGAGAKGSKGWNAAQSNKVLKAGEGFFLRGPVSATSPIDVTISGEVPPTIDTPILARVVTGNGILSMVANPYPVDTKFGESQLSRTAVQNSMVYFWDGDLQSWGSGSKGTKGWGAAQSNRVVSAGEGFFVKAGNESAFSWAESKAPYTWP